MFRFSRIARLALLSFSVIGVLLAAFIAPVRAEDGHSVESILQSGLPVESDPSAILRDLGAARALPMQPVDQIPTYGLPHGFVASTVGRLVFRMRDLSLPGKVPILLDRVYDSGMPTCRHRHRGSPKSRAPTGTSAPAG